MVKGRTTRGFLLAFVALAAVMIGCGGGGNAPSAGGETDHSAGRSTRIPAADRTAFYTIATASGTLRRDAAPAALGQPGARLDRKELAALRGQVRAVRPRDPRLARLRTALAAALGAASRAPHGSAAALRVAAKRALQATDSINTGLDDYAALHPAVAGLVPD